MASPQAEAAAEGGKMEEALLREIMRGNKDVKSKADAIRIAKDQGFIKQVGSNLALTEKGRNAARDAARNGDDD